MANLPPPSERSSRRRNLVKKEGAVLPDLPRFEKVEAPSETPAQTQPEPRHPEPHQTSPEHGPAIEAVTEGQGDPSGEPRSEKRSPRRPAQPTGTRGDTVPVMIRVRFEPEVLDMAEQCCAATGAKLSDLARLVLRQLHIQEADFAASSRAGKNGTLATAFSHRAALKLDASLLDRWTKKLDPLGLKKPGEVAFDAVQHAFNRTSRLVIADINKRNP